MSDQGQQRTPIDRLLDVGVFAPLGLVLQRHELLEQLAEAGRKQVAFSRSLGRAALKTLAKGATAKQASSTRAKAPGDAGAAPGTAGAKQVPVADLIPEYETLTARQVIARIGTSNKAERNWIRTRETAGKNRVTVLRALDSSDA